MSTCSRSRYPGFASLPTAADIPTCVNCRACPRNSSRGPRSTSPRGFMSWRFMRRRPRAPRSLRWSSSCWPASFFCTSAVTAGAGGHPRALLCPLRRPSPGLKRPLRRRRRPYPWCPWRSPSRPVCSSNSCFCRISCCSCAGPPCRRRRGGAAAAARRPARSSAGPAGRWPRGCS